MTDLELKRLRRVDLLELLIALSKENEALQIQLKEANEKLARQETILGESGSIAEAALRLNGIFEAAQQAADQYLKGVQTSAGIPEEEHRTFTAPEPVELPWSVPEPAPIQAAPAPVQVPVPVPMTEAVSPMELLKSLAGMVETPAPAPDPLAVDGARAKWTEVMRKSSELLKLQVELSELMYKLDRGEQ